MKKSWKEQMYERRLKLMKEKKEGNVKISRNEIKDVERSLALIKYGRGFEREVEILKLKQVSE